MGPEERETFNVVVVVVVVTIKTTITIAAVVVIRAHLTFLINTLS